jgi:prophage regulatory protein
VFTWTQATLKRSLDDMQTKLPQTGFVKLPTILTFIPVSKSTWWAGVKNGKYPKSVKHGGSTFWKADDINSLIESIAKGA